MKYLIMRCDELGDQYECDANREPITMVDDWKKWFEENDPDYCFEVYSFDGKKFNIIKEYDEPMESGMALCYWVEDEREFTYIPHIIKKWPGRTKEDDIPDEVLSWNEAERFGSDWDTFELEEEKEQLKDFGSFAWNATVGEENRNYIYGRYRDNEYYGWW